MTENTEMSIRDAFIALDQMDDDDELFTSKPVRRSRRVNEGKSFNVRSTQEMEEAEEVLNKPKKEVALEVIDPDADAIEHLKDNKEYVGQIILQCNSCKATRFIDPDDLVEDEADSDVYNLDDECPHCHSEGTGYHILGQVGAREEESEVSVDNDSLTAGEGEEEVKFDNDMGKEEEETKEEETETEEESEPEQEETDTEEKEETTETSEEETKSEEEQPDLDSELQRIEMEDEEEEGKKKEKKESLEEGEDDVSDEEETDDQEEETEEEEEEPIITVKDFIESKFVEPESLSDIVITDLDNDEDGPIFTGEYSEIPQKVLESEIVGFNVADGKLNVRASKGESEDTEEELPKLDDLSYIMTTLYDDSENDQISIVDAESDDEIVSGNKDTVSQKVEGYTVDLFDTPERLVITIRSSEEDPEYLSTAEKEEPETEQTSEDELIENVIKANDMSPYKVTKYGTDEYWMAESIRSQEDLDIIYERYVADKGSKLIKEFKSVTGYKTQLDEALEEEAIVSDNCLSEKQAITKANDALKKNGNLKAVVYGFTDGGKFNCLDGGEIMEIETDRELNMANELIDRKYHPTGTVRVLYRRNMTECSEDLTESVGKRDFESIIYKFVPEATKDQISYLWKTLIDKILYEKSLGTKEIFDILSNWDDRYNLNCSVELLQDLTEELYRRNPELYKREVSGDVFSLSNVEEAGRLTDGGTLDGYDDYLKLQTQSYNTSTSDEIGRGRKYANDIDCETIIDSDPEAKAVLDAFVNLEEDSFRDGIDKVYVWVRYADAYDLPRIFGREADNVVELHRANTGARNSIDGEIIFKDGSKLTRNAVPLIAYLVRNFNLHIDEKPHDISKESLNTKTDYKNRKDLSEAIKACQNNNQPYTIRRSLKEGYRYELTTYNEDIDDLNVDYPKNLNEETMYDKLLRKSKKKFSQPREEEVTEDLDDDNPFSDDDDDGFRYETQSAGDVDAGSELSTEVTPETNTTDIFDPRDRELVDKLTRIAHDTAEAIQSTYNVQADERFILADLIQDLRLVSGDLKPEDIEHTPLNDLTLEMYDAYDGFYNAMDEMVSFLTGEPYRTTQLQRIEQAVNSLDGPEFTTESIWEKIQSPDFERVLTTGRVPGVQLPTGNVDTLRLNPPDDDNGFGESLVEETLYDKLKKYSSKKEVEESVTLKDLGQELHTWDEFLNALEERGIKEQGWFYTHHVGFNGEADPEVLKSNPFFDRYINKGYRIFIKGEGKNAILSKLDKDGTVVGYSTEDKLVLDDTCLDESTQVNSKSQQLNLLAKQLDQELEKKGYQLKTYTDDRYPGDIIINIKDDATRKKLTTDAIEIFSKIGFKPEKTTNVNGKQSVCVVFSNIAPVQKQTESGEKKTLTNRSEE